MPGLLLDTPEQKRPGTYSTSRVRRTFHSGIPRAVFQAITRILAFRTAAFAQA